MRRATFAAGLGGALAAGALTRGARAASAGANDATLRTPTGDISGTLLVPNRPRPPVVLIVAGSGPTDRDGNSALLAGKNDALRQLAEALLARGIASLRYDKRGVGESAAAARDESAVRFETFVDDAAGWARELTARRTFSRLTIAGHSEGSLIGMLAAQQGGAAAFVSLEGAGHDAATVLRGQLAGQLPAGSPDLAAANAAFDALVAGHEVDVARIPGSLAVLFRPSVQPYLISWFRYDPAREIAKLRGRVAIVQGTADVQATPAQGEALHAAAPRARYVVVDGMNHLLKIWPDTSSLAAVMQGYSDPGLPIAPAVVDVVASAALGT